MKPSRLRTALIGLAAGVVYAFLAMLLLSASHATVSITYIFVLPLVMGAIPVLFSTKEQLKSYLFYLLLPWATVITFFLLALAADFEGMICLVVIVAPFLVLGSLGAFIFRLIKLRSEGKGTPLYASLLLPLAIFAVEAGFQPADRFCTIQTTIDINAPRPLVWQNIKNVKDIRREEISTHFIHVIGVPRPLDGRLDKEAEGGVRHITWEKGIQFREAITAWREGSGFEYDIITDPASIPPSTLDEHVMVGGKYFDVTAGSYRIDSLSPARSRVTLQCSYRVSTSLNFYSKWWADLILDDFNRTILEVIKNRCE